MLISISAGLSEACVARAGACEGHERLKTIQEAGMNSSEWQEQLIFVSVVDAAVAEFSPHNISRKQAPKQPPARGTSSEV